VITRSGTTGATGIAQSGFTYNANGTGYLSGKFGINFSGATDVFEVHGTGGKLFSVTDDLSSSLMSVNSIGGLPIFEVFANNTIVGGQYASGDFTITGNKVGIGTSSPTQKLDVAGSIYTNGKLVQNSSTQSLAGTVGCTINLASGAAHILSLANGTVISGFTYSSRDSNPYVNTLMLVIKYNGTASITWTNVLWANNITPTTTSVSGYADGYMLTSYKGGAATPSWIGTVISQGLVSTSL